MNTPRSSLTRRTLLSRTATGLSAVAVTHTLLGRTASAFGAPLPKQIDEAAVRAKKNAKALAKHPNDYSPNALEKKLGKVLLSKARHAAALAAANPDAKFAAGSMHAAVAAFVGRQNAKRRRKIKSRASKLLASPAAKKVELFGHMAEATLASATVKQAVDPKLSKTLRALGDDMQHASAAKETSAPKYKRIEFQLNSIECFEETDGGGEDEILLSGQLIEPSGHIIQLGELRAENFDTGDHYFYDYEICKTLPKDLVPEPLTSACPNGGPSDIYKGRKLASSSLAGPWPGTWTLVLLMGEEDLGGFGDFVSDVYDALGKEISAAIKALGGAIAGWATGLLVGTAAGSWAGPIGSAIGAAVGFAIGAVLEEIVGWAEDDIIGAKYWQMSLTSATKSYIEGTSNDDLPASSGVWASPLKKVDFIGDGAHYQARLHWRAFS